MDNFLSRDLFSGEYKLTVEVGKPVETDGQWISEVRFRHYVDRCKLIFGTDSVDCILNAFAFLHNELNLMELKFARFPAEGDTWHWFPMIPPSIDRDLDERVTLAIRAEHERFCRERKNTKRSVTRVRPDKPSESEER